MAQDYTPVDENKLDDPSRELVTHDEEEVGDEQDIDEDIYGAALWSVITDFTELLTGLDHDGLGLQMNVLRVVLIVIVLGVNYGIQLGMLYWIYSFVVTTAVNQVQAVYKAYHEELWPDGQYSSEIWETWDRKDELCGIAFSNFQFMFGVLALWWITMLSEFRKTERLLRTVLAFPSTTNATMMIAYNDDPDSPALVKNLTPLVRWTLIIVLIIPKFIIGITLLTIGTVWLTATDSYQDLILNALALGFVIEVDELAYAALLPASVGQGISQTKLWKKRNSTKTTDQKQWEFAIGFIRSFVYTFGTAILVYLWLTAGQEVPIIGVWPGYAHDAACPVYTKEHTRRICNFGTECFPLGGA